MMKIAKLIQDEKTKKWCVFLDDKVIARSNSKEYAISKVLDATGKKIKKLEVDKLVDAEGNEVSYVSMMKASTFIKNPDKYKVLVERSLEHREAINGILAEKMKCLRNTFGVFFGGAKSEFTHLKDMMYFEGGWPHAESPARLEDLMYKIAVVLKYYSFLGRENELNRYMKRYGITITIDPQKVVNIGTTANPLLKDEWHTCFKEKMPTSKKEILERLMSAAMDVQKSICQHADAIKIDAAKQAESRCGVKPEDFVNAINSAYKIKKSGIKINSALYKEKMKHVITEAALSEAIEDE